MVIEHGPEAYGVIAPMELVVNAAIFHDIAHMRVGGNSSNVDTASEKVEIYYPKSARPCEDDKTPDVTTSEDIQNLSITDKDVSKSEDTAEKTDNEVKEQVS